MTNMLQDKPASVPHGDAMLPDGSHLVLNPPYPIPPDGKRLIAEGLIESTTRWIREVFEIPEAVLLPGIGRSPNNCPIARTLQSWGFQSPVVRRTRLRYLLPDGEPRTVLFNSKVKRFVSYFDQGLIEELISPR